MEIIVKKVGWGFDIVECNEKSFEDCVKIFLEDGAKVGKSFVNGETFIMGYDSEGESKELPVNFYMVEKGCPIHAILGTAVFARCEPCEEDEEDYEVTDITEEDIKLMEWLMNDFYQKGLEVTVKELLAEDREWFEA